MRINIIAFNAKVKPISWEEYFVGMRQINSLSHSFKSNEFYSFSAKAQIKKDKRKVKYVKKNISNASLIVAQPIS
jgi:hypothetical protein